MAKRKDKNLFPWVFLAVIVVMIGYFIFNSNGLLTYFRLKSEVSELEDQIKETRSRISELEKEIDSLRNSDYKVEKLAREKYFMLKPNEQVYIIEKDSLY